jgi:hypothetical protein
LDRRSRKLPYLKEKKKARPAKGYVQGGGLVEFFLRYGLEKRAEASYC